MIPIDQISKVGLGSTNSIYSIEAYNAENCSFRVVTEPSPGLKDVPKSVITNIS